MRRVGCHQQIRYLLSICLLFLKKKYNKSKTKVIFPGRKIVKLCPRDFGDKEGKESYKEMLPLGISVVLFRLSPLLKYKSVGVFLSGSNKVESVC